MRATCCLTAKSDGQHNTGNWIALHVVGRGIAHVLISVSASSKSFSSSARSSYVTGVSSNAVAMAAVVKVNCWGMS